MLAGPWDAQASEQSDRQPRAPPRPSPWPSGTGAAAGASLRTSAPSDSPSARSPTTGRRSKYIDAARTCSWLGRAIHSRKYSAPRGQGLAPARVRGHGAARARREPHGDQAGDRLLRQPGEVPRRRRRDLRRRIGVDEAVVLVGAQRLLPPPLAAEHQPAVRRGRCRLAAAGERRLGLREDPRHDAIVQLGDDARDVPRPPAVVDQALHEGGDRRRRAARAPPASAPARCRARESRGGRSATSARRRWPARRPGGRRRRRRGGGSRAGSSRAAPRTRRRRAAIVTSGADITSAAGVVPASRRAATTLARRSRSVTMPTRRAVGVHHDDGAAARHERGDVGDAGRRRAGRGRTAQETAHAADEDRRLAGAGHRPLSGRTRA